MWLMMFKISFTVVWLFCVNRQRVCKLGSCVDLPWCGVKKEDEKLQKFKFEFDKLL